MIASLGKYYPSQKCAHITDILTKAFSEQAKKVSLIASQFFSNKPLVAMSVAFFGAAACATFQYLKNKKITAENGKIKDDLQKAESHVANMNIANGEFRKEAAKLHSKVLALESEKTTLSEQNNLLKHSVRVKCAQLSESLLARQALELQIVEMKEEEKQYSDEANRLALFNVETFGNVLKYSDQLEIQKKLHTESALACQTLKSQIAEMKEAALVTQGSLQLELTQSREELDRQKTLHAESILARQALESQIAEMKEATLVTQNAVELGLNILRKGVDIQKKLSAERTSIELRLVKGESLALDTQASLSSELNQCRERLKRQINLCSTRTLVCQALELKIAKGERGALATQGSLQLKLDKSREEVKELHRQKDLIEAKNNNLVLKTCKQSVEISRLKDLKKALELQNSVDSDISLLKRNLVSLSKFSADLKEVDCLMLETNTLETGMIASKTKIKGLRKEYESLAVKVRKAKAAQLLKEREQSAQKIGCVLRGPASSTKPRWAR